MQPSRIGMGAYTRYGRKPAAASRARQVLSGLLLVWMAALGVYYWRFGSLPEVPALQGELSAATGQAMLEERRAQGLERGPPEKFITFLLCQVGRGAHPATCCCSRRAQCCVGSARKPKRSSAFRTARLSLLRWRSLCRTMWSSCQPLWTASRCATC